MTDSINCPDCHNKTQVVNSRVRNGNTCRRRKCIDCNIIYSTREITEIEYRNFQRYKRKIIELKKYFKELIL